MAEAPHVINPAIWPEPVVENFDGTWPNLSSETSVADVEKWVIENKRVLIRTVTWNLCAKPPPSNSDICVNLLPRDRFHVYVIGTEECERSIAQSALNPSKKTWEAYLNEAIGRNYVPIRSHTLQAIHLMAFVHKGIAHLCSIVTSAAVPTGMGSTLGNKGGVGLLFQVGSTRLLFVNAHLAAHQTAERRRNAEFNRIDKMIPILLEKKEASIAAKSPKDHNSSGIFNLYGLFGGAAAVGVESSSSPSASPSREPSSAAAAEPAQEAHIPSVETIVNTQGEIVGVVDHTNDAEETLLEPQSAADPAPDALPVVNTIADDSGAAVGSGNVNTDAAVANDAESANNSPMSSAIDVTRLAKGRAATVIGGTGVMDEATEGEVDANKVNALDGTAILDVPAAATKTLESTGDLVVFMGDLNYRIKGNRKIVSSLVKNNMHEVLLHNDQLRWNMSQSLVLQNFTEGPLNFKPTYKYDVGTSVYDTSSKGRIPSWTDRILYIPRQGVTCLAYNADDSVTTSDHRPVYASFSLIVQIPGQDGDTAGKAATEQKHPEFTSESQVCTIM